ncbi:MAG: phospholipase D-like domain-containing protein, partial [Nanoarchaeota archaeon]
CPEDKCASHIINLIKNAESSIYFMSFSFTNEEIADALIMKSDLDVRGIFDSSQSSIKFSQFKRLQEFGIKVKKDSNKYKMHHKVFIIDNQTVVTGSFNPTLSADTKNDENLLIIHDKKIANDFLKEFDSLWA